MTSRLDTSPVGHGDVADPEAPPEDDDQHEVDRAAGRRPPKDGMCKRCGENKPVNRLMLCYPCWVKSVLEEKAGWREGQIHPDECSCAIPGAHQDEARFAN